MLIASGATVSHVAGQLGDTETTLLKTYASEWQKVAHADSTRAALEAAFSQVVG